MALGGNRLLIRGIRGNATLNRAALLIAAACVVLLFCAASASAQTSAGSSAATQAEPQQPSALAATVPSYPDSPSGLEKLITDMLKMQKDGDTKNLAAYIQSLILPNPDAWFGAAFGDKLGTAMANEYDRIRLNLPLSFPDTLSQIQSKHLNKAHAVLFTDSCDQESTNVEYRLLTSRTHEQPLYHVRLSSSTQAAIVGFFAYVDGAFRFIGNFQIKTTTPVLKVGGNVMAAKVVKQLPPRYPEQAKYDHVSGTVLIHAIIGTDGRVCSLDVVSGPPELVGASLGAVWQWRYAPTTLNGEPVSIDTTISVVFDLEN